MEELIKLGAFNTFFFDRSFEEALDAIKAYGCDAVEIGCDGFITLFICLLSIKMKNGIDRKN